MLNHIGLCASSDEVQRIDVGLASRLISTAGENRVPVEQTISSNAILHGVMDNWDHEENTMHGIKGSHDTVFILVQNDPVASIDFLSEIRT